MQKKKLHLRDASLNNETQINIKLFNTLAIINFFCKNEEGDMNSKILMIFTIVLAIAAIIIGLMAFSMATNAEQLALSEIVVEEVNSLSTPVLDEESGEYTFLTMYDISIANMSGPSVTLTDIEKAKSGGGFLTLLQGENYVSDEVNERALVSAEGIAAIKANPGVLKDLLKSDMGESFSANLKIEAGETKILHIGVALKPYGDGKEPLAKVVLASWKLNFDNNKTYVFRRGFPIYPIQ
jgi:hypothetical protein